MGRCSKAALWPAIAGLAMALTGCGDSGDSSVGSSSSTAGTSTSTGTGTTGSSTTGSTTTGTGTTGSTATGTGTTGSGTTETGTTNTGTTGSGSGGGSSAASGSPTVRIGVTPTTTNPGLSAVLSWSSTNASSCTANGAWTGTQATSGTLSLTPKQPGSYAYGLTCTGPDGSASGSATLAALAAGFDTSVTTQSVAPVAAPRAPSPALSGALSKVRSFEYVIDNTSSTKGINQAIAASSADLVFLNVCAQDPPIDRGVADPSGSKLIFGYIDISEAFACPEPQLFTGSLPSWFGKPNPGWPGIYTVQYWNPAWLTVIKGLVDRNIANGFDGIFLDVMTGDQEWLSGNSMNNPVYSQATSALATLLTELRTYIKTQYPDKHVYLIANGPANLALNYPAALQNLDGIFTEYAFHGLSPTNGTVANSLDTTFAANIASSLAPAYASANLPMFGNDYPTVSNVAQDLESLNFYTNLGWIPSVQSAVQTDAILATGPFMATATPNNASVTGRAGFINLLSGGVASNATLTGADQGDTIVGGPGQNTIIGGAGNDTIYAHPEYAGYKGRLIVTLASQHSGSVTAAPSVAISVNGTTIVAPTPVSAQYKSNVQVFSVNVSTLSLSSVVLAVSGTKYIDGSNNSQIVIQGIIYDGVEVKLADATYSNGADNDGFTYSHDGTISFNAGSFSAASPYLADTSDTIDGGAGANTVVYRAPSTNYSVTQQSNGSWSVTSANTAEGPDTLTNIQTLVFPDKTVSLTN